MYRSTGGSTRGRVPIRFGSYNIINGRDVGHESDLRGVSQAKLDVGVFQETKLTDRVYTRRSAGYRIVTMDAPIRHRAGVAVFCRPSPQYVLKAIQQFGPNVVVFQMDIGERRWYIIGCYLAADDAFTIERVITSLRERPRG